MAQDPWAWANQQQAAPMGNTLQSQRAPEMAPGAAPTQGPLGMAQNMLVAKGVNSGVNTATDPKSWQSLGNTLNPGSVDLAANANASGVDPMQHMLDANSGFNTYAGTAPAVETAAVETTMAGSAPLSAAASTGATAGAEAAATTAAAEAAAAATAAGTTAATGAATAGAASAAPLAAMGPVGMGVAGLLLAKKFGYI